MKFCTMVGVPDTITCATFGNDSVKQFWVGGETNLPILHKVALSFLKHLTHYRGQKDDN